MFVRSQPLQSSGLQMGASVILLQENERFLIEADWEKPTKEGCYYRLLDKGLR